MTTLQDCQCNSENYPVANPLRRVWDLVKRTAARYREWEKLKYNHSLLIAMDDRMLKDIGLSRADAIRISKAHTFWDFIFQPESDGGKPRPGQNQ